MKDEKSNLEWMIRRHKVDLIMAKICIPIVLFFPFIAAIVLFCCKMILGGILMTVFVVMMSFLTYWLSKRSEKYVAKMEQELEDLKKDKK